MGQATVSPIKQTLYEKIVKKESDPAEIITHKFPPAEASHGYKIFNDHED
jgi:S-(hydroxymethyl)glutathione dehydrogenase/alcohol dehydrogenase